MCTPGGPFRERGTCRRRGPSLILGPAPSTLHPPPSTLPSPHSSTAAAVEQVPQGDYELPLGRARVARQGSDITLVGWGQQVRVLELAVSGGCRQ